MTGTDEHGQKCEQAAARKGQPPQEYCDQMSAHFRSVWKVLDIQYDLFFRTSSKSHKQAVKKALQILYDKGDIYAGHYKGWYSVSEEIFYTEKDLVEGKSPSGSEVVPLEEPAWFFKMSKYQEPLLKHLKDHQDFIQPSYRQNEIVGFLKKPLQDLCISRPKKRVSWGVELPFDTNCVAYVWVDALLNYITGLGYLKNEEKFKRYWGASTIQLIGKDILMTHAVYWPCLLIALGIHLPKTILAHGWLLNKDSHKMSKSKGDILDPVKLAQILGAEELRYFLARGVVLGKDAYVSQSLMIKRINEDLANNLGNIFSRTSRLIDKHFEGLIPSKPCENKTDVFLKKKAERLCFEFKSRIENFKLSQVLENISELLSDVNRYLEREAPWKLIKKDKLKAGVVLYNSLEVLRISAILLSPVMPRKMEQILLALGEDLSFKHLVWGRLPLNKKRLANPKPLFPKRENV